MSCRRAVIGPGRSVRTVRHRLPSVVRIASLETIVPNETISQFAKEKRFVREHPIIAAAAGERPLG